MEEKNQSLCRLLLDRQEAARIGTLVSVPDGTGQLSRLCAHSTRHRTILWQVSPPENMCANLVGHGFISEKEIQEAVGTSRHLHSSTGGLIGDRPANPPSPSG